MLIFLRYQCPICMTVIAKVPHVTKLEDGGYLSKPFVHGGRSKISKTRRRSQIEVSQMDFEMGI